MLDKSSPNKSRIKSILDQVIENIRIKIPIILINEFIAFSKNYPDAPFYKISEEEYKIPAGWLIEQCGFKGKRFGDAGVHKNQALVLVNYDAATGQEILDLAHEIINAVYVRFNIRTFPEVNII